MLRIKRFFCQIDEHEYRIRRAQERNEKRYLMLIKREADYLTCLYHRAKKFNNVKRHPINIESMSNVPPYFSKEATNKLFALAENDGYYINYDIWAEKNQTELYITINMIKKSDVPGSRLY